MITLDVNKMPPGIRPYEVKVFYNGRDVTNQCSRAIASDEPGKEGRGIVWLYRLSRKGNPYTIPSRQWNKGVAVQTVKVGVVRWERIPPRTPSTGINI